MNLLQRSIFKNICNIIESCIKHSINLHSYSTASFWLAASPDGLIIDTNEELPGLTEIKFPKTKRIITPKELLKNGKFHIGKNNEVKQFL